MESTKELQKALQKRNFYTLKDSANVFLYAVLFSLLIGFVFAYAAMQIAISTMTLPEDVNVLTYLFENYPGFSIPYTLLTAVVFICVFLCYHKTNRISLKASTISLKKASGLQVLLFAGLGIFCVLSFLCLIEGCFGEFFDILGVNQSSISLPLNSVGWYFANLILLGVVPAIVEELIFRGIVYKGLREKFNVPASVLLGGLLFALMHQNITQFIYPFILGCVLCLVMEKTNNLLCTMTLHLFNNFTTITLSFMSEMGVINLAFPTQWWFILLSIFLAVFAGAVLYLVFRFVKFKKLEVEKEGELVQSPPFAIKKIPVMMIVGMIVTFVLLVINAVG